jgi:hypothetical protein
MSGVHLGYRGKTLDTSDRRNGYKSHDGWKWIRSETHFTLYWTALTGGFYAGGLLRPTITLRTKGWWRYLMIGAVKPRQGFKLILGPLLIEWDPIQGRRG